MLALVTIFLFTLLLAAVVIWAYRSIAGWHGFKQNILGRSGPTMKMTVRAQQGFITLNPKSQARVRKLGVRSPKGGIRSPWGW